MAASEVGALMTTHVRWPQALDDYEAEFDDVPDALAVRETERMARGMSLGTIGLALLGWGCVATLALMAVALTALLL